MTKVTQSIEIPASPEKVFALLLDLEKMNEALKGGLKGQYTSKGPVGVGSTSHMVGKVGNIEAETDMEIYEFVKDKKVSMRTIGASKISGDVQWTCAPTAKGTQLTYTIDYEMPYSILGKIIDKLKVSKDIEKNMERDLSNIKTALES